MDIENSNPYSVRNLKKYSLLIGILISVLIHLSFFIKYKIYLPSTGQQKPIEITLNAIATQPEAIKKTPDENTLPNQDFTLPKPSAKNFRQETSIISQKNSPIEQQAPDPTAIQTYAPTTQTNLNNTSVAKTSSEINNNESSALASAVNSIDPAIWVEAKFEIYSENDQRSLGFGLHHFERNNTGEYKVQINNLSKEPSDVTNSEWQLEIKGQIYRDKLGPSFYQKQGKIPTLLISLGDVSPPIAGTGMIFDNILDRSSMFYQFMFTPPATTEGKLTLTDGKHIVKYTYINQGLEILDTPMGKLRTIKIMISAIKSTESIELWLAPDYKYLPLKVRHTDINQVITDQIVYDINLK